jgi:hypothetical protein
MHNKKSRIKRTSRTKRTKKRTDTIFTKNIKVFSYNISWESMTGSISTWKLCNNDTNKDNSRHYSVCVNNIAQVIEENDTDFVCLQESSNVNKLIKESPRLKLMKYESHKSGLDEMITFWNPKYKLLYSIKSEFEKGRPWMATVFIGGLCLINVHFGHYIKNDEFMMMDLIVKTVVEGAKKGKNRFKKNNNIWRL